MGFVQAFALEQLSLIYSAHFDGFVTGDQGDNTVNGTDENELLMGGAGDDDLNAGKGDDFLEGCTGNDYLNGGKGDDVLLAGSGNDELYGGLGSDVLTGGEGSDRFVYRDFKESGVGERKRDVITDFSSSEDDKIDLSSIAGDFVFIGSSNFTGAKPEIRFDDGILQISNYYEPDTAPTPVFEIQLLGNNTFGFEDLLLWIRCKYK